MAASLTSRGKVTGHGEATRGLKRVLYPAAALSLAAALIHLRAAPEHLAEWWGYGAFFLIAAVAQALYGLGLLRLPGQRFLLAGVAGNLAIISLYVTTRTVGVPFFGPHAWHAEEIGALDLAATAAELALVVALVSRLEGRYRARAGGMVLALAATGVLIAGAWGFLSTPVSRSSAAAEVGQALEVPGGGGTLRVDAVIPEKMAPMQMGKFARKGMSMSGTVADMTPEGQRRFNVDVTLAAPEDGGLGYSVRDFRVAGEGMRETAPLRSKLADGVIPAGSAVSGTLVFQVPEEAKDLVLSFDGGAPVGLDLKPAKAGGGHGGH